MSTVETIEVEINGQSDVNNSEKNEDRVQATKAWIDAEFLEEVLNEHKGKKNIKVIDYDVTAAVGTGDNYLSIIYRTLVKYRQEENGEVEKLHLIIKGAPTAKFLLEFIEEVGVFRKELDVYYKCLPKMKAIMREFMPEEKNFIAPDVFRCSRPTTIIMDDLIVSGYKMADRKKQLDLDHCKMTLKSLARFHALSVKVYEEDPDLIRSVATEFYSESNREKMEPFMEKCFPALAEEMKSWEGYSRFAGVISDLGRYCYDKMLHLVQPTPNSLTVLNHGDFWVNNMLYKYDDAGNVAHVKLVDFQLARYCSPAMDLLYFFFSSPRAQVLQESIFELVKLYHDALITDLNKLGVECSHFTLEQLHKELKDRAYFGFVCLATIMPVIVAKPADAMDLDNYDPETIDEVEFPLRKNYRYIYFQQAAGQCLELMENLGYVEAAKEIMRPIEEKLEAAKAAKLNGST